MILIKLFYYYYYYYYDSDDDVVVVIVIVDVVDVIANAGNVVDNDIAVKHSRPSTPVFPPLFP